jgi:lipoic acid synthetase
MNYLPRWLKKDIPDVNLIKERLSLLKKYGLHSVCESAHCPNMGECFSKNAVTFMILGNICTRNCRFCAVEKGVPLELDVNEPENIFQAVLDLNLDYVVITSVTRDDLSDGGAIQFARTIAKIRENNSDVIVEVLIPDFKGNKESTKILVEANPDVIAHNLETVSRLYEKARPTADYNRSLNLLKTIKELNCFIFTKSAILLGMGEIKEEVIQTMKDLRKVNCDILTIGQYLSPSENHLKVEKYISPEEFAEYKDISLSLGFKAVSSGPFVRSSYNADEVLAQCMM